LLWYKRILRNIEEFQQRGYDMIDFLCDYFKNLENYPVLSKVKPGEITSKLPTEMPDEGENWDKIMKDVKEIVIPGLTLWQHPNFYGFYPLAFSFPAVLGDLLSTGLGVQGMLWLTSPACTEIETVTLDWLAKLLSLPEKFLSTKEGGGVIQGTASEGTLVSMIAARHKKLKEMLINEENEEIIKSKLIAYTSDQAHSSVKKACLIMGISLNNFRIINSPDGLLEFSPEELEKEIIKDLKNNLIPFFVSTTIGTTSTSAVDPISKIGDICEKYNIWLHVDAAYAGSACICEEYRHYLNGIEKASSFLFNPHKWLLVNFDCSTLWVTNRNILIDSLSVVPEYLRNTASISGKYFYILINKIF
jgi:aromatic-L-amino-acid decarboxylase